MSRRDLLGRAVLTAVAIATVPAVSAEAATVTCGQVITTSITVDNDLTNCPGKGLVVGADNITIDLNGHTIDGDAPPGAPADPARDGIDVRGHDGVTVRDGDITDFTDGVQLGSTAGAASR